MRSMMHREKGELFEVGQHFYGDSHLQPFGSVTIICRDGSIDLHRLDATSLEDLGHKLLDCAYRSQVHEWELKQKTESDPFADNTGGPVVKDAARAFNQGVAQRQTGCRTAEGF